MPVKSVVGEFQGGSCVFPVVIAEMRIFVCEMRFNKEIQTLADACARKYGFFCASYLGRTGEEFVFASCHADSECRCNGLPNLVIVENGEARFARRVEDFRYLKAVRRRDYRKGREIFREFERKVYENDFANDGERSYVCDIVGNQRLGYDVAVDRRTLYEYLEIADRFGMELELVPLDYSIERNDGWEYCLKLKKPGGKARR